jgi:hypothetical protein
MCQEIGAMLESMKGLFEDSFNQLRARQDDIE